MKNIETNTFAPNHILIAVPEAYLKSIEEKQNRILELLESEPKVSLKGDYVKEEEAKKEFGMSTTWFWEKRKSGELAFVKVGGRVFYKRSALLNLFEKGTRTG